MSNQLQWKTMLNWMSDVGHRKIKGLQRVKSNLLALFAGLLCCGDSTFPGIGVPAVAASGAIVANTLVPVWDHWKLLDRIGT